MSTVTNVPKILTKYACPVCDEIYNREWEAQECCPREAEEVFVCSVCGEDFEFESQAEKHFDLEHPEEILLDAYGLPIISKAELEKQGQERLFK